MTGSAGAYGKLVFVVAKITGKFPNCAMRRLIMPILAAVHYTSIFNSFNATPSWYSYFELSHRRRSTPQDANSSISRFAYDWRQIYVLSVAGAAAAAAAGRRSILRSRAR